MPKMKYKHTITIADIQMNIVTEEEPEVVEAMVGILDRRIREIFLKSENRCPKIEAALLCALDYCAEKNKLQETINRMEEERRGIDIEAMIAELAELKSENESLNTKLTYTEDQARTMKNGIDIANDQIRILKTQVEGVATVSAANEALEAKVAELQKALAEKDAELESKTSEVESKNAELENKALELETKTLEIETLNLVLEAKNLELEAKGIDAPAPVAEEEVKAEAEVVTEEAAEEPDEVVIEIVVEEPVEEAVPEIVEEPAVEEAVVEETVAEETVAEEPAPEPVPEDIVDKRPVAAIAENVEESFEIEMKPLRRGNVDENQLTIDSQLEGEETAPVKAEKPSVEKEKQKAQKRVRSMFDLITFDNV